MRIEHFILDGNRNLVPTNMVAWMLWLGAHREQGVVGKKTIGRFLVSTVFLGGPIIDGSGCFFETMVFGGDDIYYQNRYKTWALAELGHERTVRLFTRYESMLTYRDAIVSHYLETK